MMPGNVSPTCRKLRQEKALKMSWSRRVGCNSHPASLLSPLLLFEDVAPRSKDSVLHSGASGKCCKREMGEGGSGREKKAADTLETLTNRI